MKNYRRHGLLEVFGLWTEILDPSMTVEHPVYRMFEGGTYQVLDGMDAVKNFYRSITDDSVNVFGPIEESLAVNDSGFSPKLYTGGLSTEILRSSKMMIPTLTAFTRLHSG